MSEKENYDGKVLAYDDVVAHQMLEDEDQFLYDHLPELVRDDSKGLHAERYERILAELMDIFHNPGDLFYMAIGLLNIFQEIGIKDVKPALLTDRAIVNIKYNSNTTSGQTNAMEFGILIKRAFISALLEIFEGIRSLKLPEKQEYEELASRLDIFNLSISQARRYCALYTHAVSIIETNSRVALNNPTAEEKKKIKSNYREVLMYLEMIGPEFRFSDIEFSES